MINPLQLITISDFFKTVSFFENDAETMKKLKPIMRVMIDSILLLKGEKFLKVGISMKTARRVDKMAKMTNKIRGRERLVRDPLFNR